MKLKKILFMMLITVIGVLGITSVKAATISDSGKYVLRVSSDEMDPVIDGEYVKLIRFNVADGETTVKLSELVKEVTPFNGKNEFSHWETDNKERAPEELKISDFTKEDTFYTSTGEEIKYTNGFDLSAKFEGKALKESGKYYIMLDVYGATLEGKRKILIESKKEKFKTIDLTKYTPVRKGYTFKGWDLNGKIVKSIDSSAFAKDVLVNLKATYTKDTFEGDGIVLILNANGGTIEGKETNKYDYIGIKGNSGATMSLLPYIPVRKGYTFNGWNTKKDGSGEDYKYVYWRIWDKDEETDKKFDKDTLIKEESGYERYKNVTLYASWTKQNDTVKEIKSNGNTKASVVFDKEVSKSYVLDIKPMEIKKSLIEKNVKYLLDINILENGQIIKINNTKMKIKVALPEDLKGYKKYEVVYILNGEINETISAKVENGYIVFETSHLSQYGVIAKDKMVIENPKTGDNVMVNFATAILSIIGLSGMSIFIYKNKQIN